MKMPWEEDAAYDEGDLADRLEVEEPGSLGPSQYRVSELWTGSPITIRVEPIHGQPLNVEWKNHHPCYLQLKS